MVVTPSTAGLRSTVPVASRRRPCTSTRPCTTRTLWPPFQLALHVRDEIVHHGAEVGVLQDLFGDRSSLPGW